MHFEAIKEISHSGTVTIEVNGSCMGASLPDGCRVRVQRDSFYWPGDILVFGRGDDCLVSHRLLGYFPGNMGWNVLTRADTSKVADAPVPLSRVIGKVIQADGRQLTTGLHQRVLSCGLFISALMILFKSRIIQSR